MATVLVIASTGEVSGVIQNVENYDLNAYNEGNDLESFIQALRNGLTNASASEQNALAILRDKISEETSKELLKNAYEEGKRDGQASAPAPEVAAQPQTPAGG